MNTCGADAPPTTSSRESRNGPETGPEAARADGRPFGASHGSGPASLRPDQTGARYAHGRIRNDQVYISGFPIFTAAIAWMCWKEFAQLRGRYGGRGFFGVLRNAAAHKVEIDRIRAEVRKRRADPRTPQEILASRAAPRDRLTRPALTLIGAQSAELRARKIAQKALKSGDHERMLGLIADNQKAEPRSADIARGVLGAIARV